MAKHIFVTGGTGLLGRQVLWKLYEKGYKITALKREHSNIKNLPTTVEWVTGDLKYPESYLPHIMHVDTVIHCAAMVNFNPKQSQKIIDFNTAVTKEIVNSCLEHDKTLLHVSSVSALGSFYDEIIHEESAFDLEAPNTGYALSKYKSEMEVWRGVAEGLNAVIVNPTMIIGIPSNWKQSMGAFWMQVKNGLLFYPTGSTGFVDARDVANIMIQLMEKNITGKRFIINAETKSYRWFYSNIAKEIGKTPPKWALPYWLGTVMWRVSNVLLHIGVITRFTKAIHQISSSKLVYSNEKIKKELSFSFRSLADSIHWVSRAFLNDQLKTK